MRMLKRNGGTVGALLTFVAVLAMGAGFFNFVAAQQPRDPHNPDPGGVIPPPRAEPAGGSQPPILSVQTPDVQSMSIEQLVEHVGNLKTQQAELKKQEAAAVAELRKKLKAVNEKLEKMDGNPAIVPIFPPPTPEIPQ